MRARVLGLSIALLTSSACVGVEDAVDESRQPVINGTAVPSAEAESNGLVKLTDPDPKVNLCTGTLIANRWVLTGKHCVSPTSLGNPSRFRVRLGTGSTELTARRFVPHPDQRLDIMLVELAGSFTVGGSKDGMARDRLWHGRAADLFGSTVTCYGYGRRTASGDAGTLRRAGLRLVSAGSDRPFHYALETNAAGQILAVGDSGGPCFADVGGRRYLAGVNVSQRNGLAFGIGIEHVRGWLYEATLKVVFDDALPLSAAALGRYKTGVSAVVGRRSDTGALVVHEGVGWDGSAGAPPGGTTSDPALAFQQTSGALEVLVRGGDNAIWRNSKAPGFQPFGGWSSLGGSCTSGPGAATFPFGNSVDVLCRGQDGTLYHGFYDDDGGGWTGFYESVGAPPVGMTTDPPAAIWHVPGVLDVFVRGNDGAIWQIIWNESHGWSQWWNLGGEAATGPVVTAISGDLLYLFAGGHDGQPRMRVWAQEWWSAWERIGAGSFVGRPAASLTSAEGYLTLGGVTGQRFVLSSRP